MEENKKPGQPPENIQEVEEKKIQLASMELFLRKETLCLKQKQPFRNIPKLQTLNFKLTVSH